MYLLALLPKEEELVMMSLGCQEPDNYNYNDTMTLFFKNQVLFCFCYGLLFGKNPVFFFKYYLYQMRFVFSYLV